MDGVVNQPFRVCVRVDEDENPLEATVTDVGIDFRQHLFPFFLQIGVFIVKSNMHVAQLSIKIKTSRLQHKRKNSHLLISVDMKTSICDRRFCPFRDAPQKIV